MKGKIPEPWSEAYLHHLISAAESIAEPIDRPNEEILLPQKIVIMFSTTGQVHLQGQGIELFLLMCWLNHDKSAVPSVKNIRPTISGLY